jgi:hypothetical protein
VLEGSLLRGEERLAKLREQTVERNAEQHHQSTGAAAPLSAVAVCNGADGGGGGAADGANGGGSSTAARGISGGESETGGTTFSSLNAELTAPPKTRDEGKAQWEEYLRDRFIRGEDDDFDYALVDEDEEYDVLEREDREEAWFEEEDPGWASTSGDEEGGRRAEKVLRGETGIQDF